MKKLCAMVMAGVMAMTALTGCGAQEDSSRLDQVKESGKLQVICMPYFAPYEFIDNRLTGQDQYQGADMELARYIAEQLDVELEIIPLEWSAVLTGITQGRYDMAISGLAYTEERAQSMELSDIYSADEADLHGFLVREEDLDSYHTLEDFSGKIVGYMSGTLQETMVNEQVPEDATKMVYESNENAVLALMSGKVDAVAVSYDNGEMYMSANDGIAMGEPLLVAESSGVVVACPKGETELIEEVNKILAVVNEEGLYNEWWQAAITQAEELGLDEE